MNGDEAAQVLVRAIAHHRDPSQVEGRQASDEADCLSFCAPGQDHDYRACFHVGVGDRDWDHDHPTDVD